jgi:hypothetical protein
VTAMGTQEGATWARQVIARGRPDDSLPLAEKAEAYEDMAAAYQVLAAVAAGEGDMDAYIVRSELAEQADELARECRGRDGMQRW